MEVPSRFFLTCLLLTWRYTPLLSLNQSPGSVCNHCKLGECTEATQKAD